MERKGKPTFYPLPGKVAVQLETSDKIGSLYVPLSQRENRVIGEVIAIGEDVEDVAIGDTVMFGQNSGAKVSVERESVLILREAEILTRVRWEEAQNEPSNDVVITSEAEQKAMYRQFNQDY